MQKGFAEIGETIADPYGEIHTMPTIEDAVDFAEGLCNDDEELHLFCDWQYTPDRWHYIDSRESTDTDPANCGSFAGSSTCRLCGRMITCPTVPILCDEVT